MRTTPSSFPLYIFNFSIFNPRLKEASNMKTQVLRFVCKIYVFVFLLFFLLYDFQRSK